MKLGEASGRRPLDSLVVTGVVLVLLAFTLALVVGSFPAGIFAVLHGGLSSQLNYASLVTTFFWVGPVPVVVPVQFPLAALFLVFVAVYGALFFYAGMQQVRPARAAGEAFREGAGALLRSPLFVVLVAISFLSFTGVAITWAAERVMGSIGNPFANYDQLLEFGALTVSPLREEIGFRVVLVGFVALILSIGRRPREALKALWRPSVLFEGAAVGGAAGVIVWAAVLGSAVTFGVCHVNCGGAGGWNWAQFPYALWGGIVLGYLYVRYGIHVAILTHWGVDYLGSVYSYFGQSAYGVPANSIHEYIGQYLVDADLIYLAGVASFLLVAYLALKKVLVRKGTEAEGLVDKGPGTGPSVRA